MREKGSWLLEIFDMRRNSDNPAACASMLNTVFFDMHDSISYEKIGQKSKFGQKLNKNWKIGQNWKNGQKFKNGEKNEKLHKKLKIGQKLRIRKIEQKLKNWTKILNYL